MSPLLSIDQVAELLGVHKDTVRNLPIAFTRVGRQRRYHPAIVAKYLEGSNSHGLVGQRILSASHSTCSRTNLATRPPTARKNDTERSRTKLSLAVTPRVTPLFHGVSS